jgi:four helix bundle protein
MPMINSQRTKQYDLEERTFNFTKRVIEFVNKLQMTLANIEVSKQLVRSAGSVGANYIEANESFSKKDFIMRVKICRKEAKESCYWLKLVNCSNDLQDEQSCLIQESVELTRIFGAILEKTTSKK